MYNIEFKNGICIQKENLYSIYHMYTEDALSYYLCIPNNDAVKYIMVIDFPKTNLDNISDSEQVKLIKETADKIYQIKPNAIYLIPNITPSEIKEAENENDHRSYKILLNKLKKYVNNAYWSIKNDYGMDIVMDQTIDIVEHNKSNNKLIQWLDIYQTNYFKSLEIEEKIKDKHVNDVVFNEVKPFNIQVNNNIPNKQKITKNNNHRLIKINGYANIVLISLTLIITIIFSICLITLIK